VVRTQVYLTKAQHRAVRSEARRLGVSMTEVIRRLLSRRMESRTGLGGLDKEAVLSFVGLGDSGFGDTSERHDQVLDEANRRAAVR